MKPPPFRVVRPGSVDEALEWLAEGARVLAGGQSLLPLLNARVVRPEVLVDIGALPVLDAIELDGGAIRAGCLVRQEPFRRSSLVAGELPLVHECLGHVGHLATRNRGTVAGSIAHADASAELPLALAAHGGRVVARSTRGERSIDAADLFVTHFTTTLAPDELVVETVWPVLPAGAGAAFEEHALRHGDFAEASAACVVTPTDGPSPTVGLWLGAPAERPLALVVQPEPLAGAPADLRAAVDAALDATGLELGRHERALAGTVATRALVRALDAATAGAAR